MKWEGRQGGSGDLHWKVAEGVLPQARSISTVAHACSARRYRLMRGEGEERDLDPARLAGGGESLFVILEPKLIASVTSRWISIPRYEGTIKARRAQNGAEARFLSPLRAATRGDPSSDRLRCREAALRRGRLGARSRESRVLAPLSAGGWARAAAMRLCASWAARNFRVAARPRLDAFLRFAQGWSVAIALAAHKNYP